MSRFLDKFRTIMGMDSDFIPTPDDNKITLKETLEKKKMAKAAKPVKKSTPKKPAPKKGGKKSK